MSVRHTFRYPVDGVSGPGAAVRLEGADAHHLARVVRRRPGDEVELVDRAGTAWPALVRDPGPPALLEVTGPGRAPRPAPPVDLYMGLAEWGRVDLAAEKLCELGARSLTVFRSARARRVPDAPAWARRRERLGRVAEAAARQSGRATPLRLGMLVAFDEVVQSIGPGEGYVLDPRGRTPLGAALAAREAGAAVALVVGPDAGLDDAEVARAEQAGLVACTLGAATLRAETAALAAAVLALDAVGHLRQAAAAR